MFDMNSFRALLEADSRLKGQLYKTAREAAELKPYRDIFPDLESAKTAVSDASTFYDVREVFKKSTTRDGAIETLARLAELSYERDDAGNVLMQDGQPVIGEVLDLADIGQLVNDFPLEGLRIKQARCRERRDKE